MDMLAEVPDPRNKKGKRQPISFGARTHGCRSLVWTTQLYTDRQMGHAYTQTSEKFWGSRRSKHPPHQRFTIFISDFDITGFRKKPHTVDNTDFSTFEHFHGCLEGTCYRLVKLWATSHVEDARRTHLLGSVAS